VKGTNAQELVGLVIASCGIQRTHVFLIVCEFTEGVSQWISSKMKNCFTVKHLSSVGLENCLSAINDANIRSDCNLELFRFCGSPRLFVRAKDLTNVSSHFVGLCRMRIIICAIFDNRSKAGNRKSRAIPFTRSLGTLDTILASNYSVKILTFRRIIAFAFLLDSEICKLMRSKSTHFYC